MEEARIFISWLAGVGGTTVILVVCYLVGKGRLRLEREVMERDKRIIEEQTEKIFWRNMAVKNNQLAEDSQQIGRAAVSIAERSTTNLS